MSSSLARLSIRRGETLSISIDLDVDSSIRYIAFLHDVPYENDCDVFDSFLLVAADFMVKTTSLLYWVDDYAVAELLLSTSLCSLQLWLYPA